MKLTFFCPMWGSDDIPFEQFLLKAKDSGYQGVEVVFPLDTELRNRMVKQIKAMGLEFIAQHFETNDRDFEQHQRNYRQRIMNLVACQPKLINSQTGKDYFTREQNLSLIDMARDICAAAGVTIHHETHRGKFSFAAHITEAFLKDDQALTLTADFSHWCCVAESMLEDQSDALQCAIERSHHIHARVGHSQSAQVADPRAPECQAAVSVHLSWWRQIIKHAELEGREEVTITPEFGPAPYLFSLPYSQELVASQWDMNVYIKQLITEQCS